jgi:hypothetical protein
MPYSDLSMGTAKDLVEIIGKEKWLVYFLLFWAGSFVLWAVHGLMDNGFQVEEAADALDIIAHLMDLLAGVVLALLVVKCLKSDFLGTLSKERLLVYFLLLWAGSFIFWGLADIAWDGPWALEYAEDAIGLIGGLFELAAGAVLALFGWKLFQSKEPEPS